MTIKKLYTKFSSDFRVELIRIIIASQKSVIELKVSSKMPPITSSPVMISAQKMRFYDKIHHYSLTFIELFSVWFPPVWTIDLLLKLSIIMNK